MNKKLSLAISTLTLFMVASCASQQEKEFKNPFDPITLKETMLEGKTTQTQMLQVFGAPDIVTEGSSKEDVWTYSQMKHESKGSDISADILGFLPIPMIALAGVGGGVSKSESGSKSVTLMVFFDKKKVLRHYQLNKVKM